MSEYFEYPTEVFDRLKPEHIRRGEIKKRLKKGTGIEVIGVGSNMMVVKISEDKCVAFDYGGSYQKRPMKAALDSLNQQAFNILYPNQFPKFYEAAPKFERDGKKYPGYTVRQLVEIDIQATEKMRNELGYPDETGYYWGLKMPDQYQNQERLWVEASIPLYQEQDVIGNFAVDRKGHFVYLDVLTDQLESEPGKYFGISYTAGVMQKKLEKPFWSSMKPVWDMDLVEEYLIKHHPKSRLEPFMDLAVRISRLRILEETMQFLDESDRTNIVAIQTLFDQVNAHLGRKSFKISEADLAEYNQALSPAA